jgi:methylenetetrahydrofolate reductase (NADPH)
MRDQPVSPTSSVAPLDIQLLVDFRPASDWSSRLDADLADRYQRCRPSAAWLLGEHVDDAHGLGVAEHARRVKDRFGLPLVVTVTGRNRTRHQAEHLLEELAGLDLAAVHCVTGDHPAARFGLEHQASFGLDSQMLVALASERDLKVSVAESPASPPVLDRAAAGIEQGALGGRRRRRQPRRQRRRPAALLSAVRRGRGLDTLIGPVPLIADQDSARRLTQFPGLALDASLVAAVLHSPDPAAEGRQRAVDFGRALLDPGRKDGRPFSGLNLSGLGPADPRARADFVIDIIDALG